MAAFLVDRVVFLFGNYVEADIQRAGRDVKDESMAVVQRELALNRWLQREGISAQLFRDPARR